jgi:hypothetical protein
LLTDHYVLLTSYFLLQASDFLIERAFGQTLHSPDPIGVHMQRLAIEISAAAARIKV